MQDKRYGKYYKFATKQPSVKAYENTFIPVVKLMGTSNSIVTS